MMSVRYAQRVRRYYQDYRPNATAELGTDSQAEDFFRSLAQQIEDQVSEAEIQIAGPDLAGESYLSKVGRLNMARSQAEELVLANLLYANPPEQTDTDDDFYPQTREFFADLRELQAGYARATEEVEQHSQNPTVA
jgi:hypothetical protein